MTDLIASATPRTAKRMFVALASAATLMAAAASSAQAQAQPPAAPAQRPAPRQVTPPKPGQPPAPAAQQKPAPAAPAAPQQAQGNGDAPQLIFSPWVKLCNKDADPKAKKVCVTVKDGRVESGLLVVSVAIIEMDGEQKKLLRMSLPYGVNLQYGPRLIVAQHQPPTAPFVTCLPPVVPPGGCIADSDATADMIGQMK